MTTIAQIITDAYREGNNIPVGQVPTTEEQVEGLALFNRFFKSVLANELGDFYTTVSVTETKSLAPDWVPNESTKIYYTADPLPVKLNPSPKNGERFSVQDIAGVFTGTPLIISGNGRKIEGVDSVTLNTDFANKEWFYRDDIGDWVTVVAYALTDIFPFPPECEEYFVLSLAYRINTRNGTAADAQMVQSYRRSLNQFRSKYSNRYPQQLDLALSHPCLSSRFTR